MFHDNNVKPLNLVLLSGGGDIAFLLLLLLLLLLILLPLLLLSSLFLLLLLLLLLLLFVAVLLLQLSDFKRWGWSFFISDNWTGFNKNSSAPPSKHLFIILWE